VQVVAIITQPYFSKKLKILLQRRLQKYSIKAMSEDSSFFTKSPSPSDLDPKSSSQSLEVDFIAHYY
jgi:hypothetical protein